MGRVVLSLRYRTGERRLDFHASKKVALRCDITRLNKSPIGNRIGVVRIIKRGALEPRPSRKAIQQHFVILEALHVVLAVGFQSFCEVINVDVLSHLDESAPGDLVGELFCNAIDDFARRLFRFVGHVYCTLESFQNIAALSKHFGLVEVCNESLASQLATIAFNGGLFVLGAKLVAAAFPVVRISIIVEDPIVLALFALPYADSHLIKSADEVLLGSRNALSDVDTTAKFVLPGELGFLNQADLSRSQVLVLQLLICAG